MADDIPETLKAHLDQASEEMAESIAEYLAHVGAAYRAAEVALVRIANLAGEDATPIAADVADQIRSLCRTALD